MLDHSDDFLRLAQQARSRIREIPPPEAAKLTRDGALLVDVREKEEYQAGHLSGAVHLSRGLLEMNIHELAKDKEQPIVCYCGGGNRGALAADTLQSMGYTNVFSIAGGLKASQGTGGPKPAV